jgi:hypothetical protein
MLQRVGNFPVEADPLPDAATSSDLVTPISLLHGPTRPVDKGTLLTAW